MIEAHNLTKDYGDKRAVDDLSWLPGAAAGAFGRAGTRVRLSVRSHDRLAALEGVVNLKDLRLAGELDSDVGQHWHQPFTKRLQLLPGVPDLAHLEVAV